MCKPSLLKHQFHSCEAKPQESANKNILPELDNLYRLSSSGSIFLLALSCDNIIHVDRSIDLSTPSQKRDVTAAAAKTIGVLNVPGRCFLPNFGECGSNFLPQKNEALERQDCG